MLNLFFLQKGEEIEKDPWNLIVEGSKKILQRKVPEKSLERKSIRGFSDL